MTNYTFNADALKKEMNTELFSLLKYWTENAIDHENGGFIGARDFGNHIIPNAEKGAVLNARILWSYAAAYNFTKEKVFLETATRAYNYLVEHFIDKKNGGLFWALDASGEVTETRKQIYAQGFGIYGLSEYYKASGNKEALDHAIQLFELIEAHSFDPEFGGYIEALASDWSKLDDMRLSPKDANEPKSMNTHLHILEPYTNLYRVWKDSRLEKKIRKLIEVFLNFIVNQENGHFELFFDYNWQVKSTIVSYGHDIEGAWLLIEAAHEIGDPVLSQKVEAVSLKMVEATLKEGMSEDGSIYYEKENGHLDDDRHWWPQAEAMVGLVYAWKVTGDEKYLAHMQKTWSYIKENLIDLNFGEWHWRVNSKGFACTEDVKMGFWKCPYHNSRALIEVMNNLKS